MEKNPPYRKSTVCIKAAYWLSTILFIHISTSIFGQHYSQVFQCANGISCIITSDSICNILDKDLTDKNKVNTYVKTISNKGEIYVQSKYIEIFNNSEYNEDDYTIIDFMKSIQTSVLYIRLTTNFETPVGFNEIVNSGAEVTIKFSDKTTYNLYTFSRNDNENAPTFIVSIDPAKGSVAKVYNKLLTVNIEEINFSYKRGEIRGVYTRKQLIPVEIANEIKLLVNCFNNGWDKSSFVSREEVLADNANEISALGATERLFDSILVLYERSPHLKVTYRDTVKKNRILLSNFADISKVYRAEVHDAPFDLEKIQTALKNARVANELVKQRASALVTMYLLETVDAEFKLFIQDSLRFPNVYENKYYKESIPYNDGNIQQKKKELKSKIELEFERIKVITDPALKVEQANLVYQHARNERRLIEDLIHFEDIICLTADSLNKQAKRYWNYIAEINRNPILNTFMSEYKIYATESKFTEDFKSYIKTSLNVITNADLNAVYRKSTAEEAKKNAIFINEIKTLLVEIPSNYQRFHHIKEQAFKKHLYNPVTKYVIEPRIVAIQNYDSFQDLRDNLIIINAAYVKLIDLKDVDTNEIEKKIKKEKDDKLIMAAIGIKS